MAERPVKKLFNLLLIFVFLWILRAGIQNADAAEFRVESDNAIVDQAGRRLTIKKPFERIISLYGAHTENLFRLGLFDKIIGVSKYETYPPEALKKPVFSYHDDPEKLLAARPDRDYGFTTN